MDAKFTPARTAIMSGNIKELEALIKEDPSLVTARSSCGHPTLLQCLALDAVEVPNRVDMAKVLVDAGAEINEPLVAAASINNAAVADALLDAGADVNGADSWSPLEEALYWGQRETIDVLLKRGAKIKNLRAAAGLGRVDLIESFFDQNGNLKPEAGKIDWPFRDLKRPVISEQVLKWTHSRQEILDNALVYAVINNQLPAARLLLIKGADINAIPPGFDYAGTALHNAAVNGLTTMVEFLLDNGADPTIRDTKVNSLASGWADHGGHQDLKRLLEEAELKRSATSA